MGIKIIESKPVSAGWNLVMLENDQKKRTLVLSSKHSSTINTAMPADTPAVSTWSDGLIEPVCTFAGVNKIAGWYSKAYVGKIWKKWEKK
jgi:hypothetical protein